MPTTATPCIRALPLINRFTIGKLGGAWELHVDGGAISGASQQATPVEVDGVIYVQSASQSISAVDARTGSPSGPTLGGGAIGIVRGVAVAQGRVFASLTGRRVVALDQATGQQLWQITLNDANFPGGTTPTALVYYDGLVVRGNGRWRRRLSRPRLRVERSRWQHRLDLLGSPLLLAPGAAIPGPATPGKQAVPRPGCTLPWTPS